MIIGGIEGRRWPSPTRMVVALLGLLLATGAPASPPLSFTPIAPRFADAADQYRALWDQEGERIVDALERVSGLRFPDAPIEVLVTDSATMTALDGRTIRIRAGYSGAFAKATFAHEMGHRLAQALPRTTELDDHRVLYLFLYDVWTDLYGRDFADRMVAIERRIRTNYDYDAAWAWALSMTRAERQARLKWLRSGTRSAASYPPVRTPPPAAPSDSPTRSRSCAARHCFPA